LLLFECDEKRSATMFWKCVEKHMRKV